MKKWSELSSSQRRYVQSLISDEINQLRNQRARHDITGKMLSQILRDADDFAAKVDALEAALEVLANATTFPVSGA